MIALEVFYIALATIAVMAILQLITFVGARLLYPPEPKIIYRDVPVYQPPPPPPVQQPQVQLPPVLTQTEQNVQLPEYEPRKPASTSLRVDPERPLGIQETRPAGT